jgi:hypothetical protein
MQIQRMDSPWTRGLEALKAPDPSATGSASLLAFQPPTTPYGGLIWLHQLNLCLEPRPHSSEPHPIQQEAARLFGAEWLECESDASVYAEARNPDDEVFAGSLFGLLAGPLMEEEGDDFDSWSEEQPDTPSAFTSSVDLDAWLAVLDD